MISLLEFATVLSFTTFVGICVWAWRKDSAPGFAEAAHLPFAMPDEVNQHPSAPVAARRAGHEGVSQ